MENILRYGVSEQKQNFESLDESLNDVIYRKNFFGKFLFREWVTKLGHTVEKKKNCHPNVGIKLILPPSPKNDSLAESKSLFCNLYLSSHYFTFCKTIVFRVLNYSKTVLIVLIGKSAYFCRAPDFKKKWFCLLNSKKLR